MDALKLCSKDHGDTMAPAVTERVNHGWICQECLDTLRKVEADRRTAQRANALTFKPAIEPASHRVHGFAPLRYYESVEWVRNAERAREWHRWPSLVK